MLTALSGLWLAVAAALIVRAARQRNALIPLQPRERDPAAEAPKVAVIVPARDEAANILRCLESLLTQHYPAGRCALIVVDDESSDGTAAIVAELAATDARIKLLDTAALPAGWTGKVHACWRGAAAAPADAEWLCFLDADVTAGPQALASAVAAAEARGLDLLSLAPRHTLGTFAERLMLPCALYVLAFMQDLRRIQAPGSAEAVATGQFMLLRRSAYAAVGGHSAVRAALSEDRELARLMKRRGLRVLLMDGGALLSARMYDGWRTLWPGLARNMMPVLGGPLRTAIAAPAIAVLAWLSVALPVCDGLALLRGEHGALLALGLAGTGSAALFALYIAGAAHFRTAWWYGALFPLGYTIGALMALDSVRWRLMGRVRWRGRVYRS